MSTLTSFLQINANRAKFQAVTLKAPDVAQQTKYFQDNIGKITSGAALVKNPRLLTYALTAFGLGDRANAKALFAKVLAQGVAKPGALANTLNDPKILAFAKAFDFAGQGAKLTAAKGFAADIVNRFVAQTLETDQGKQNPGVELALYFQRNAPKITSVYGILADKKILTVVQTALGISPLTSGESIDQQAKLLTNSVKLADLQDPKKLQAFVSRFAALYDYNNGGGGGGSGFSSSVALSLFGVSGVGDGASLGTSGSNSLVSTLFGSASGGSGGGFDANTLLSLQNLRNG